MNKNLFFAMFSLAFLACHKDVHLNSATSMQSSNSVTFTDTAKIPINDLGTGTYMGFTGGLYPGGANTPSGTYASDLVSFVSQILPFTPKGKVDSTGKGKIGVIGIGGSTCGDLLLTLKNKTQGNPATNPYLRLVSCAWGGGKASLNNIMNPNDKYWSHVDTELMKNRLRPTQVEVIYFDTEDSTSFVDFPGRPYQFRDEFEAAMRVCKSKFIKLKVVYVTGRTTTFFRREIQHKEPSPYYNGWGLKFAIEDQINGVPGMKYDGADAVAPLVTWAWYQWADGTTTPRQDGFIWTPYMTADGLHANDVGLDTLSNRLQNFLLTDPVASIWYKNNNHRLKN